MEIASVAGLLAIVKIIIIDILLAGDNAIVIGMAAKNLPPHHRKQAILWGTVGAIVLRLVMAVLFVEALNTIPALHLIGGLLLLWIGYSLLDDTKKEHSIEAKDNLRSAIMTIVIADGVMGIDNVIGVVGAAEGHMGLVVAGMLITVPIIIWGSTLFVKLIDRYPVILYAGGGILGWVGGGMIEAEHLVAPYLAPYAIPFKLACVALVLAAAVIKKRMR